MIHELCSYHAAPGKLAALNARFRDVTLGYFEKYGIESTGYWTYAHGGAIDDARAAGENTSDEIAARSASVVARIESMLEGLPSLLGQVEAAVDLAQQRSDEGACSDVEAGDEVLVFVEVMVIGGENFPIEQFHEAGADACSGDHYHGPQVFSLEGSSMFDPNGSECGFGKSGDVTIDMISVSEAVLDAYGNAVAGQ